jgi:hypothetical protein
MLRRDLEFLRRVAVPAAILVGLVMLVSAPRYHLALTDAARAYTFCAFGLLFAGTAALMVPALGRAFRRGWLAVRVLAVAAFAAALAVLLLGGDAPLPPAVLVLLAGALAAGCWPPPRY